MTIKISRGKKDKVLDRIVGALKGYEKANPGAQLDLYRQSPVSVRIRVVDLAFQGVDKSSRHEKVWTFLEQLPEDVQGDISMLVLVTPEETKSSFANLEFEDPVPSHV